jgi:hypothetical protein
MVLLAGLAMLIIGVAWLPVIGVAWLPALLRRFPLSLPIASGVQYTCSSILIEPNDSPSRP